MNIILYIAAFFFFISAAWFLISFLGTSGARREKKCTKKSTAILTEAVEGRPREDCYMEKTVKSRKRSRKRSLIWMLISAGIMVYAFLRTEETPELPFPSMTTVGQFCEEITALEDKTPTALTYTKSENSPDTFSVTVDDPSIVQEILEIILHSAVGTTGWQVDMYRLSYEEYRFAFGEESFSFGFIPNSYFCYGGKYYELGENQLAKIRSFLYRYAEVSEPSEMTKEETAAEPQSKWYSADAVLNTTFLDNGDEARSLIVLTLSADGECLTGVIEGAYDVLSIDKQLDGYVICYTYGDFYSHEATRSSRVTVENGEMVITDIAQ